MVKTNPTKADLRTALRRRRSSLSSSQQHRAARALVEPITGLPCWTGAQRIALYLANDGEIDTSPLDVIAREQGKQVYLPVITDSNSLEFALYDNSLAMVDNRYGIPEPPVTAPRCEAAQLDIMFVPLVGFDKACNRLGMGGGFYDRTLENVQGPLRVGLAYDIQCVESIPSEPWDVALDCIVTDAALYRCRGDGR